VLGQHCICVTEPTGGPDQPERIRLLASQGLLDPCGLDAQEIADRTGALLSDAPRRRAMRARIEACGFLSGLPAALGHLARLADGSPAGQSRELDASGQPGDLDPRILVATQDLLTREYYEILSS